MRSSPACGSHGVLHVSGVRPAPAFVALGKGFPGGEYPASRLIFSAALDCMPQFGALVTNGQEELASLAYLITMRWAEANAEVTRAIGDTTNHGCANFRLATRTRFSLSTAGATCDALFQWPRGRQRFCPPPNGRGMDVSAQTYKADCPPVALTKFPLIITPKVIDFIISQSNRRSKSSSPLHRTEPKKHADRNSQGNQNQGEPRVMHAGRRTHARPTRARVLFRDRRRHGLRLFDEIYRQAGATIVPTAADAWAADMVVKVKEPRPPNIASCGPALCCSPTCTSRPTARSTERCWRAGRPRIAYETVQVGRRLPLLEPMSEIAGRMSTIVGALST